MYFLSLNVMSEYDEIKNLIKESGRLIYWFDSNNKLLVVDSSKTSSKHKIIKKKYEGLLYRLSITFHTGTKVGQGGPLSISCRVFYLKDNNITKSTEKNKEGTIWFEKKWLERKGEWNEKWLEMIVKKLRSKFEFKIGIYLFTDLF